MIFFVFLIATCTVPPLFLILCCCSFIYSCPTLGPHGLQFPRLPCPSLHLLEFSQTLVHWVGDAIQPSHPLSPPSSPALSISHHQGLFQWVATLHIRWPKYWSFSISPSKEYSVLISFRIDWFDPLAVQGNSQKSSPAPQFESISSAVFSLLYGPTLTSIHDYWKNHNFDYTDLF